jgi:hypothetical protein
MKDTFTAEMKWREAQREVKMRRNAYPRMVDRGNMSAGDAARRIAIMAEIEGDYRKLADADRLL